MIALKLIAFFCLSGMSFLAFVLVMIYGWGLTPANWFWIIGGAVWQLMTTIITWAVMNVPDRPQLNTPDHED